MSTLKGRLEAYLKNLILLVLRHPALKVRAVNVLKHFPFFYSQLSRFYYLRDSHTTGQETVILSEDGLAIYRELLKELKKSSPDGPVGRRR